VKFRDYFVLAKRLPAKDLSGFVIAGYQILEIEIGEGLAAFAFPQSKVELWCHILISALV
jgi:hypothetical protein